MQILRAERFLWLLGLLVIWTGNASANKEELFQELVASETSLIRTLRDYIDALDRQLQLIKEETAEIERIHDEVGERVEEYMENPLNVLTILKRFQSNWPHIERLANETLGLADNLPDFETELDLPSEEEYEAALLNLLRLQSVYDLEPSSLSLGIVNGLKLGSSMSWSDCLEMARKSDRNGEHAVAKYWLETALGRLPDANNATGTSSEQKHGKVQILVASLNMDYRAGDLRSALATAKELLVLRPESPSVHKTKANIERALKGTQRKLLPKSKAKNDPKSVEQSLLNEICRSPGSRPLQCHLDVTQLRMLRLEQLNEDPYVALYHDMLSSRQTQQVINSLEEESQYEWTEEAAFAPMRFTNGRNEKTLRGLHYQLGLRSGQVPGTWQTRRHSHEHVQASLEQPLENGPEWAARAMLSLQPSRLGGAIAFPQLELGVNVPQGALLLWRVRSLEDMRSDYRSRQLVCPVLLGVQLSAWTELP